MAINVSINMIFLPYHVIYLRFYNFAYRMIFFYYVV